MLPENRLNQLEHLLKGSSFKELQKAALTLMDFYKQTGAKPQLVTRQEHLAYAIFRMPATCAALGSIFRSILEQLPHFFPLSVCDLGAGPGTAGLALETVFEGTVPITCFERDSSFIEIGKQFLPQAQWKQQDIDHFQAGSEKFDLVVASYVLGEVQPDTFENVVKQAWVATRGLFVIAEPGTPQGYATILKCRKLLLSWGGTIVAPCPHQKDCPLEGSDWCHFSARLGRSRLHRLIKGGTLGYEDEKFSYLVVSKEPFIPQIPYSRILREPKKCDKGIELALCCPDGTAKLRKFTMSEKSLFKLVKKLNWGDVLPDDLKKAIVEVRKERQPE